jgi:hypothetical protein
MGLSSAPKNGVNNEAAHLLFLPKNRLFNKTSNFAQREVKRKRLIRLFPLWRHWKDAFSLRLNVLFAFSSVLRMTLG